MKRKNLVRNSQNLKLNESSINLLKIAKFKFVQARNRGQDYNF